MLATGGFSIAAIQLLKDKGCKSIRLLCIIAAPEGVKAMQEAHPDVDIYIGAMDQKLNDHGIYRSRTGRCWRPYFRYQIKGDTNECQAQ